MALSETLRLRFARNSGGCNCFIVLLELLLYSFLAKPESFYYISKVVAIMVANGGIPS